jgi:hypothetical protein
LITSQVEVKAFPPLSSQKSQLGADLSEFEGNLSDWFFLVVNRFEIGDADFQTDHCYII